MPEHRHSLLVDNRSLIRGDASDLLRATFVAGALILALRGDYHQAGGLLLVVAAALLPRVLDVSRPFELAFVVAISFHAWGNVFGLFARVQGYDTFVHFVLPMLAAPAGYVTLLRLDIWPDPVELKQARRNLGVWLSTFFLGLALAAVYEVHEWTADHLLGTHLQQGNTDTVSDLLASGCGAGVGGLFLVMWLRGGRPAMATAEEGRATDTVIA